MKGKFYKTSKTCYDVWFGTQPKRPEWTRLDISEGQFRLRV